MYRDYGEQAAFFVIYVREAHASDGWATTMNVMQQIAVMTHRTEEERAGAAQTCLVKLALDIPVLVDRMDNRVDRQYFGWPDRLYVIDRDGRVAYRGGPGPKGFRPQEAEEALRKLVAVSE
jgi:hypothetical protein